MDKKLIAKIVYNASKIALDYQPKVGNKSAEFNFDRNGLIKLSQYIINIVDKND